MGTVRTMEALSTWSHLGIRFWDPVTDAQIRDGLVVQASPSGRPRTRATARRGVNDIYSFANLPGMRDFEHGNLSEAETPAAREFLVQAADPLGRYLPVAFPVVLPLPYRGLYLSGVTVSPVDAAPRGLHLFSAPTRAVPPGVAAIRGELRRSGDGEPAAHAVVEVATETGDTWYGVSDGLGRFLVLLPYPILVHGFGGSPASAGHRPLFEQSWSLLLSVRYQPEEQRAWPGADVPDYLSVLQQAPALIHQQPPAMGHAPLAGIPVELRFDHHPTVRTEGLSQLLVEPGTASP